MNNKEDKDVVKKTAHTVRNMKHGDYERGMGIGVGGGKARVAAAKATVEAGVAVMGHVGLMPQAISVLGGFRPQGQSGQSALRVMLEAKVTLPARAGGHCEWRSLRFPFGLFWPHRGEESWKSVSPG